MQQFKSSTIVLRRVNYGEADRIITFITPENGKVSAIAKGVRKPKSKMGGALEPFSESTITFGQGRGELKIVLSTRLEKFYGNIITDYDRLQFGYEALKMVDKLTEDVVEAHFFTLLKKTFVYLNELQIPTGFTEMWFRMQLENILGRAPDLAHDAAGAPLESTKKYAYDVYDRGLVESGFGALTADHIKLLRLALTHSPAVLAQVKGASGLLEPGLHLLRQLA